MPPNLDVYVVSKCRDRASIERFLEAWIDRAASEDRGDEELMLLPLNATGAPAELNGWDWEPALTLTHAIERGLERPPRAFALYLNPRDPVVDGVTLAFTTDDEVVFGLSVDDPDARDDRLAFAKDLLQRLAQDFDAHGGYVAAEEPAPLVAANIPPTDATRILFSWSR
jgi:hypothetical protein